MKTLLIAEYLRLSRAGWLRFYGLVWILEFCFLLLLLTGVAAYGKGGELVAERVLFYQLIMVAILLTCLVPLAPLSQFPGELRSDRNLVSVGTGYRRRRCFVAALFSGAFSLALIAGSFLVNLLGSLAFGGPEISELLKWHLFLFLFSLVVLLFTLFVCASSKSVMSAAAVVYLVLIAALLSVFLVGPVLQLAPQLDQYVIGPAILANPIVVTSSLGGFDILRSRLYYVYTPLSQRRFDYPPFQTIVTLYSLASLACILLLALKSRGQ